MNMYSCNEKILNNLIFALNILDIINLCNSFQAVKV